MITPELLHRLRLAQRRSAQEQQLLSGRDWILVAGLVQLLSGLHPLFVLINQRVLGSAPRPGVPPGVELAAEVALAAAFVLLWRWARYAPFRAAMTAVVAFLLVHGALGLLEPRTLLAGAVVKSLILVGLVHAARTGYLRHRPL
ncbi:MAG TPA: hypothetical protein VHO24_13740 [Opitutaceae bacterium]|jgi:hypothetical protein|nr:hypothetical protein [Lacunisphaera sp.]HEX2854293.1 hypothetical protein [Opitutaceae bacterium]